MGAEKEYGRFTGFGMPPENCADYAFLLHMIKSMDPTNGRGAIILPHGVLFRGGQVERIGHNFIWLNKVLENLSLPNLKVVGDNFLYSNETLDSIDLPNLVSKGFSFIFFNDKIRLSNKVLRK